MGIIKSERELFDSKNDFRDHKVVKYMLKSISKDVASVIATPLRAMKKAPRVYLGGYVNGKDSAFSACINILAGLTYALGLAQSPSQTLVGCAGGFVGVALPYASVEVNKYLHTKYQEAVQVAYGMPTL